MGNSDGERAFALVGFPLLQAQMESPNITADMTNKTLFFLFSNFLFDAVIYFGDEWPDTEAYGACVSCLY
jgi:hypothetical protein